MAWSDFLMGGEEGSGERKGEGGRERGKGGKGGDTDEGVIYWVERPRGEGGRGGRGRERGRNEEGSERNEAVLLETALVVPVDRLYCREGSQKR